MVKENSFVSRVMEEERSYQVLLPANYNDEISYPVLYLLHGADQNYQSWTKYTFLEVLAEDYPCIFAIPDASDRWYLRFSLGYAKLEEYLLEFIAHIDNCYNTVRSKDGRGIAGISMGGYGAVMLGMKHQDLIQSASALSGVMDITNHNDLAFDLGQSVMENTDDLPKFHLFDLARKLDACSVKLLFDSGTEDAISNDDSLGFHNVLEEMGIPHEYNRFPGDHDWHYWDTHLPEHLDFHMKHLQRS